MDAQQPHKGHRPPSLSLVTITSLRNTDRLIFDLMDRQNSNSPGQLYDSPSLRTPTIVIDQELNVNSTIERLREKQNSPEILAINGVNNSQLIKHLKTLSTQQIMGSNSDCESIQSNNSKISKGLHSPTESMVTFNSIHETRNIDNISIGGSSVCSTIVDINLDTNFDSNEMNTRLVNFLSVMYALVLVVISAIICLNDLDTEVSDTNNIFTIVLAVIGFVWLLFLHWDIHHYKRWAIEYLKLETDTIDNKPNDTVLFDSIHRRLTLDGTNTSLLSPFQSAYRFNNGKHSTNFYLKFGMTVFCFGSIVHMGVEIFTRLYFFTNGNDKCQALTTVLVLLTKALFSFYQLFIAYKYPNILINRYRIVARFASMHLMGTSIAYWFQTIIYEAIEDYAHKAVTVNGTTNSSGIVFEELLKHNEYCLGKSIASHQTTDALPHLYPFTIEYNIILASVWYIIWSNIGKIHLNVQNDVKAENKSNETNYYTSVSINANCHASSWGLFGGLSILLITCITIVIFFMTIKHSYSDIGVTVYSAQIGVLIIFSCLVIPLAYNEIRKLNIVNIGNRDNSSTAMDDLLVLVPILFYLIHYILSINALLEEMTFNNIFMIIIYILTIVQVLIQSPFIVDGIRRCSNSTDLRFRKPGRELVTFALILNITLWILNTFELKYVERYQGIQEYYGKMTWMIISHTTLPLMLFYRFHSSVCLSDIWKYGYEIDCNSNHN